MAKLTTHVLDTAHGCPAAGMTVTLHRIAPDGAAAELKKLRLDADGRAAGPLLQDAASGRYRLTFDVAGYFRERGVALPEPPFLDQVALDFGLGAEPHYHVPLLVSPWSYSTYRGS